jgi:hypothetical protein
MNEQFFIHAFFTFAMEGAEKVSFLQNCHSERSEESSIFTIIQILRYAQDDKKLTFSAPSHEETASYEICLF